MESKLILLSFFILGTINSVRILGCFCLHILLMLHVMLCVGFSTLLLLAQLTNPYLLTNVRTDIDVHSTSLPTCM